MLGAIIGFLSGIISGMGIGGGAILIPALIMTQGIEQKLAQGINLVYFIPTAVIALIVHIKNKSVEIKTALIIGLCGIAGAISGAIIAMQMNNDLLTRLFGAFLLFIGVREIYMGIAIKGSRKRKK